MDSISSSLSTTSYRRQQGRRFFGCRNYRPGRGVIPKAGCNHFRWCDVELSDRVKEVINTLKMEKAALLKENKKLAAENAVHSIANSEMLIMKKRLKRVKFALLVTWLLLVCILVGKI
ncbi:hypothetical protein C2S52_006936 [Perilla frutescens var. hirtella]|nr:hypothetical protein C2S52_006936 [Perilla frutescens var. hirtella]